MHEATHTIEPRRSRPRRARRAAVAGIAAVMVAAGASAAAPDQAEAMGPGDGFYYCLSAGGNYMECWYWWNWLR
jgi:hypothetical protein